MYGQAPTGVKPARALRWIGEGGGRRHYRRDHLRDQQAYGSLGTPERQHQNDNSLNADAALRSSWFSGFPDFPDFPDLASLANRTFDPLDLRRRQLCPLLLLAADAAYERTRLVVYVNRSPG
jgi:hypothetical protein